MVYNQYRPHVFMGNSLMGTPGVWTIGTSRSCTTIQNDTLQITQILN